MLSFKDVPATGFFRSRPDAQSPSGDLNFDACLHCGLLRRRDFARPPDYTDRPRPTGRQLPAYRVDLLAAVAGLVEKDDLIAEIGSNDGTFIRSLQYHGYTNIFGVEPSLTLAESSRKSGLRVQSGYFGPEILESLISEYGDVRLAICRHTLEHVPFPGSFITAIRDLLVPGRGRALIEVPDSVVITDRFNFFELWDEHLHYFTERTLELLLNRHGLSVEQCKTFSHLDTRNILVTVSVGGKQPPTRVARPEVGHAEKWRAFSRKFKNFANSFRAEASRFRGPTFLIGASHPQCNFVNFLGIGDFVDFMIDDDPRKSEKYPPIRGPGARIITTEQFFACPNGGTVILTGFGYPGWTDKIVEQATEKAMMIVDPKSFSES